MSLGAHEGQGLMDDRGMSERCCFVINLEVAGLQVNVVRPPFDPELPEHIGDNVLQCLSTAVSLKEYTYKYR